MPLSLSRTLLEQVDHWQSFLALVNMIMFCTGIPGHYPVNETTSSLTLTFWYTLQVRDSESVCCDVKGRVLLLNIHVFFSFSSSIIFSRLVKQTQKLNFALCGLERLDSCLLETCIFRRLCIKYQHQLCLHILMGLTCCLAFAFCPLYYQP